MTQTSKAFEARHYNLAVTLNSGQAFRWRSCEGSWEGVVGKRWVNLRQQGDKIICETAENARDWAWLREYLQLDADFDAILSTFPLDKPMQDAVRACRGLRLLKQEPWEVLASFILSSTKQIVQIRQVVDALCKCFGEPVVTPPGHAPVKAFPSPGILAAASEADLRACKMGFRAPYLKAAAEAVSSRRLDLAELGRLSVEEARAKLEALPGVGPKVANCVLLSAYNFPTAFPLDVWVLKALCRLYFPGRRPKLDRLRRFSQKHFGPWSGYAQLYLFHYQRVILKNKNASHEKRTL